VEKHSNLNSNSNLNSSPNSNSPLTIPGGASSSRSVTLESENALFWKLEPGTIFSAGNSVFGIVDVNSQSKKITVKITKGPNENKQITISAAQTPYVCGRTHEADFSVSDRELSRKHFAIIYTQSGEFAIVDLKSTNGTFVRLVNLYKDCGNLR